MTVTRELETTRGEVEKRASSTWCGRRGSNPHGGLRGILSRSPRVEIARVCYAARADRRALLRFRPREFCGSGGLRTRHVLLAFSGAFSPGPLCSPIGEARL